MAGDSAGALEMAEAVAAQSRGPEHRLRALSRRAASLGHLGRFDEALSAVDEAERELAASGGLVPWARNRLGA